jgi:hypothetical protein
MRKLLAVAIAGLALAGCARGETDPQPPPVVLGSGEKAMIATVRSSPYSEIKDLEDDKLASMGNSFCIEMRNSSRADFEARSVGVPPERLESFHFFLDTIIHDLCPEVK